MISYAVQARGFCNATGIGQERRASKWIVVISCACGIRIFETLLCFSLLRG